ncbi:MAG: tail fiber domain-containing protein, partial [Chthoniobacterales bacterium]
FAVLFAAITLPTEVFAQASFSRNINASRKLRSVIVGGSGNQIFSNTVTATIGGGQQNVASAPGAVVAGGYNNTANNDQSTVSGGYNNQARGHHSTVGGGSSNDAGTDYSTVPGGVKCRAMHPGTFVWSGDSSEFTDSFAENSFTVRAEGGVRFYTANGTGIGAFLGPSGSWQVASDSNLKTKVTAVDPRVILSKVAAMPVTEWEYKALPNRRYIGPMAQDFHATFGLGYDDKSISTLDSDGVMYAAIKGLVEELKDRDKTIEELKMKLESVEQRLDSLPPAP